MVRPLSAVAAAVVACAAIAVAACAPVPKPGQDPRALEGVEWRLTSSSMKAPGVAAAGITIRFDGQRVAGFSGVNQYGGAYSTQADGTIKIGPLQSTLMAGPQPLLAIESAYVQLLESCDTFVVKGAVLTLSTPLGEHLIYEAAKSTVLPGSRWVVTGYNNGKQAVVSPSLGSTLTLEFGGGGRVTGNGGVNTFEGPYTSTATTIAIGPLASTRMSGPEPLLTQEARYLASLQLASAWRLFQGRLELRDASGAMQVTAIPAK